MAFYAFYPPSGGGSSSNASVGTVGGPALGSATEIAGVNGGLLVPVAVTSGGAIVTSPDPAGVADVIVDSSALPTGASTSALQTTGNNSLSSIDGKTPALGQALAAASVPVVLTAAQLSTLTPLTTVTVTQATGTNLHTVVDASALPTGAATESTLAAMSAKLPALGQAVMAASQPVVIASNQTAIPVTSTASDITVTGNITIINSVPGGTATAGSAVLSGTLNGISTASVQVTGTYTGALSLQYTVDGTNWVTVGGTPFSNVNTGVLSATIASATQGIFQFETTGVIQCRITALAAVTGTAVVTLRLSQATNIVTLDSGLPAGANSIGNIGTVTTVTAVTAITNALPAGTNVIGFTKQGGKTQANAPVYNAYGTTPVTTATYVQLVASTTAASTEIEIFDSSGQAIYLATGAAASEVNQIIIIPGGNGRIPLAIAAGTRVSVKALTANATAGYITINFYA